MKLGSQIVLGACHRVGTPTDPICKGHDRWDKYPLLLKWASPRTNIASSECRRYVSSRRFARTQTDFWGTMVGTGRFELPTPRTPSECSTRLSHVPTRKEPAASHPQRMGLTRGFYHLGAVRAAARFSFRSKVIEPTNLYPRGRMLASGSIRAHIETPMES
jgi:hypothetical protein